MHEKQNQRMIVVTLENLGRILSDIAAKKYTFAANDKENDLWLDLNLDHDLQNESVIRVIQAIFGEFYGPIKESEIIEHSCKNT
jgi:hypothetical protein